MLTGLWAAISPWSITLQDAGGNAAAVNLISGLAVAAVGAFALAGPRGFAGLQRGDARRATGTGGACAPESPEHVMPAHQAGREAAQV
jgi:hypothetical protein